MGAGVGKAPANSFEFVSMHHDLLVLVVVACRQMVFVLALE